MRASIRWLTEAPAPGKYPLMRFVPMLAAAAAAVTAPAVAQDLSKALPGWAPEAARRICEAYRHEPLSLERLVALLGQPVADQSWRRQRVTGTASTTSPSWITPSGRTTCPNRSSVMPERP